LLHTKGKKKSLFFPARGPFLSTEETLCVSVVLQIGPRDGNHQTLFFPEV
jgi:hypothetical protein